MSISARVHRKQDFWWLSCREPGNSYDDELVHVASRGIAELEHAIHRREYDSRVLPGKFMYVGISVKSADLRPPLSRLCCCKSVLVQLVDRQRFRLICHLR
jgi:hypothetical protein